MKTINQIMNLRLITLLFAVITIVSCSSDDDGVAPPPIEEEVEVITDVTLIFTPVAGGLPVTATAQDPDGEGIQELQVLGAITLAADTEYTLTYNIFNNLETPGEDIGEEILEEDNEHQLFYSFTNDAFASPMGNGNIDTASDPVNYNDEDENGNNVGLSTAWTTGSASSGGMFTVRLQHQPDLKSATTGANDGDTDFDLTFELNIQ